MTTRFCSACGAEYVEGALDCPDCGVALEGPGPALDAEDEGSLVYELPEWSPELRAELTRQLDGRGIAHRWDGDDLVVAEADEDRVDAVMDELDPPDGDGDDDADDEADWEVMSALFEAADRLANAGSDDVSIAGGFVVAADAVAGRPAPFGFDEMLWLQVRRLAKTLSEDLETDAPDSAIVRDAAKLRDLLRAYV